MKWGFLKPAALSIRVISIGNIQAGGTGKTPLVAKLANEAIKRGKKVCILSRGYQGEWERAGGVISPGSEWISPSLCGDEVALLHHLCPQAWIGVGANRVRQFEQVMSQQTIDLVFLDDGFQHWKIKKDFEIVALTSARPGEKWFRDFPSALRQANLGIWTKGKVDPRQVLPIPAGLPMLQVQYQLPPAESRPLWWVTGIADWAFSLELLRSSGYMVQKSFHFEDHFKYTLTQLEQFLKDAETEKCRLATTGKDWVKWKDLGLDTTQILVLEPELVWSSQKGEESKLLWDQFF